MRLFILHAVLAALVAGCVTVGPDYAAPSPRVPAKWQGAEAVSDAQALSAWWHQFNDNILDSLITSALISSPDLRTAQAKLREARARTGLAESALSPSVTNSVSGRRAESAGSGVATDTYSIGFDASWEIDLFGGARRSIEAAKANADAAEAGVGDAQVSLAAEVARNYLDLRTQQARLAIARDNLQSLAATAELIRWRYRAGLVTELDVLQALSTLEQVRSRLPALESSIEADLNKLAVLSGQTREDIVIRVGASSPLPTTPVLLGVTIPAETLRQRPDVRAAERRLAAQTANIGVASAERYPALRLSGNVGLSALTADALLHGAAASSSMLASLVTPIFDGGRIRRNIAIQNALQEQAMIGWEKTVAQALADVETALIALAKSREREASLSKAGESAWLAVQLANHRYAAGLIDYATLQDTQRTLLSVDDSRVAAQGDEAAALVQLYKSLGGGFSEATQPGAQP